MERKVNEPFKDQSGKMVKAVKSGFSCSKCVYCKNKICIRTSEDRLISGACGSLDRSDNQDVIFKEETK